MKLVYEEPTHKGWLVYAEDGRIMKKGTKVAFKNTYDATGKVGEIYEIERYVPECSTIDYALHTMKGYNG